ncbi:hypothetical protein [Primorskyibacter sp. S87]|uniref:hypothetical protein n=1 Tax=Primorskyibacter sp. S87 TaxID=3415126 RepID=UPI003C7AF35A
MTKRKHTVSAKERAAFNRLEKMKQAALAGATLPLSNNAAARALSTVSPEARRLLLGMIAVNADKGGGSCNFEDAMRALGGKTLTWQVLDELHTVGLMRFNNKGNHEMHPLFGSIAHRLFEFGHDADGGGKGVDVGTNTALYEKRGHLVLVSSSIG